MAELLLFMFIFFLVKSTGTEGLEEMKKSIRVLHGSTATVSSTLFQFPSDRCLVCKVEVVKDLACLQYGKVNLQSFFCKLLNAGKIEYSHFGSTISNSDCVKLKVTRFYHDKTDQQVCCLF